MCFIILVRKWSSQLLYSVWVAWLNYYLLNFQLLFIAWMFKTRLKWNLSSLEVHSFLFFALKLTPDEVNPTVIRFRVSGQHILGSRTHTRPTGPFWVAECSRKKPHKQWALPHRVLNCQVFSDSVAQSPARQEICDE